MKRLHSGDHVKTIREIKLLREGVTVPAGTVGYVRTLLASDAGYVKFGDYEIYIHAGEVNSATL